MRKKYFLFVVCLLLLGVLSPLMAQQNLVPNPGFESGSGDTFTNWTKANGATYLTATTAADEVHGGTRALKSAGPGFAGQQYQVQMLSDLIPTTIGTSYTFKIWVKAATAGGTVRFSTQPSALYGPDMNVPANVWTQLSWTFTANVTQTRIALDLGQSNVVYYLDDMEMPGTAVVNPPTANLTNYLPNSSLEEGTGNTFTNWSELNGAGSFLETTNPAEVKVGVRALKVVSTTPRNAYEVQFASPFLNTPVGKHFQFRIYIKAAVAGGQVRLSTISPLANYGAYAYSTTTTIGTDWQLLTLDFTPVEPTTRVAIDLGTSAATYFVDDMSLTSTDALLIGNGGFETGFGDTFTNWTKQNGASFLTATTTETHSGGRALRAEVTGSQPNAGQPYSVQLINDAATTVVGTQYTFSIWAKATTAGSTIRFSTTPNSLYGPDTPVPTTWTKLSWTFTANETQTKLVLDLGKNTNVYYLDDADISPAIVNLVTNGSFELGGPGNNFTNWSKYNGAANITETTVAAEVNEGSRAVKVVNTAAGEPYSVQLVSDPMSLSAGKNYTARIYVRSNVGGEVIRFSTNATAGAQYGPNYTTTTAWQPMTWTFTANDASTRIVLDMGTSVGTFFVDNVTVVGADDCAVKYQVPAGQTPIATGKNKFLGSAYSTPQMPNFEKYFNQVTPENAGKWGSIEGTQGVYNFTEVDQARAFAKQHGFPFRFHVLVWGAQQPTWLKPLNDAQKVQKIKAWFQAVATHYDGSSDARARLEYIEVANETLNDPPNNLGPNLTDPASGDYVNALKSLNAELGTTPGRFDWVVNSFKLARQYFPCETKLMLNEYNAESGLADDYVTLVNLLKADNLLDVIGLQGHSFSTRKYDPNQSFAAHTTYLRTQLNKIAATGLPIMITELDIDGDVDSTYTVTTNVAVKQAFQKSEYERIFGLYWNHPSVIGITLWGYLTGHWRTAQEAFLVDACSGQEKPALRDYLNNTLNNTPNSVRASGNPPLGTSFLPKICGIPVAAQYACASEVPVSSTATITASAFNCPGPLSVTVQDVTTPATPTAGVSYTLVRTWTVTDACGNVGTASQRITVSNNCSPATTSCGSPTATLGQALSLVAPTYNCATNEFKFNTVGGDGSPISYSAVGISSPTTSCTAMVDAGIAQDIRDQKPSVQPFTLSATQNGITVTYSWNALTACSSVTVTPPNGLALLAPEYNCLTGAFIFKTQGGNGDRIEYMALGITGWTTNPNQFVDTELRTAVDAQPITLKARQNGTEVTYIWSIRAQCPVGANSPPFYNGSLSNQTAQQNSPFSYVLPTGAFTDPEGQPLTFAASGLPIGITLNGTTLSGTPTQSGNYLVKITATDLGGLATEGVFTLTVAPLSGGSLQLVAPEYNCLTGAFIFKTQGGNGDRIEYMALGITGWTTDPNQFVDKESRTANDVKPFTLMARQSGNVVTYVWDLKASCGRARAGIDELGTGLQVRVLGNPVESKSAEVEISGIAGKSVQLNLTDSRGDLLHQLYIHQAQTLERVSIPLGTAQGILLLRVSTGTEQKTLKLLKP
ncbi:endo-1,4-beta-xylanase [Spirosoma jeollabukense]